MSLVDRELPDRADLSAEEANLMAFYPSWDDATFVSGQRQHSKVIEVIG